MAEIGDRELLSLVERLDESISKDGAVVVEDAPDGDGTLVVANRAGYLRLGVEFLKAALAKPVAARDPARVEVELDYLVGLEEVCYSFERREDLEAPTEGTREGEVNRLVVASGIAVFAVVLASLLVGFYTILRWVWSLLF